MSNFTQVVIGIQARSTSRRFPRKIFEEIDGKPMLKHVIGTCERAATYMNTHSHKTRTIIKVALLVPYEDEICQVFRKKIHIIEGPEDNVLARYKILSDEYEPDYVARVTADCPLIPSYVIMKHIKLAIVNRYDYVSNVDEQARTAADGMDCEVMSRRMLEYLDQSAKEPSEREHVTLRARTHPPDWAKIGHVVGFLNLSELKLSVDTYEDLERVRKEYARVREAVEKAERLHGRENVHRL
jgi:spore coat polysaccharide biosynthesis protein SpsF